LNALTIGSHLMMSRRCETPDVHLHCRLCNTQSDSDTMTTLLPRSWDHESWRCIKLDVCHFSSIKPDEQLCQTSLTHSRQMTPQSWLSLSLHCIV